MKKINLPIAAKDSQKIDLSNRHIGTTDFFRPFLNYALETVPKDKLKVNIDVAVQGYPLAGPNLGQFKHHLNSFFVPFRTIMSDWVNFISEVDCRYFNYFTSAGSGGEPAGANGTSLIVGKRQLAPQISRTDLFYLFFPNWTSFELSDVAGSDGVWTGAAFPLGQVQATGITHFTFKATETPFVDNLAVAHDRMSIVNARYDVVGDMFFTDQPAGANHLYIGLTLTNLGRLVYQLIRSLGLKLPFGGWFKVSSENHDYAIADFVREVNDTDNIESVSCLPILALYKCFIDWYVPSKFKNDYDQMLQTMSMLQYPFRAQTSFNDFHVRKPYPLLYEVILYTQYPNDYFTNAFLYPNGSNSGEAEGISLPDFTAPAPSDGKNVAHQISSSDITLNTPYLGSDGDANDTSALTTYALRALRALNNYVRRNQIVGYRAVDRFLARFGAKLDYTQTNRSIHIASNTVEVFPKVVVAQADNYNGSEPSPEQQQALLGGKAANILFGNSLKHDFETNEQGLFLVLSSVTPKVGYVQGLDRMFLHKKIDDFYIPEFDSLGVQPILKDELFSDVPTTNEEVPLNQSGKIFGYATRYADYKYKQDMISGDFELHGRNAFLESLHTFRMFDNYPDSINNEFLIGNGSEYDRIFMMSDSSYDHLQVVSMNKVDVYRHVDSAADVKDITDGSGQYYNVAVGGNYSLR